MAGTPSPTTKWPRLGPEDKARKQKMIDVLKARGLLSESAERWILSGRR
jgi:hypothetical protein